MQESKKHMGQSNDYQRKIRKLKLLEYRVSTLK